MVSVRDIITGEVTDVQECDAYFCNYTSYTIKKDDGAVVRINYPVSSNFNVAVGERVEFKFIGNADNGGKKDGLSKVCIDCTYDGVSSHSVIEGKILKE
jgi:hypothetical protein